MPTKQDKIDALEMEVKNLKQDIAYYKKYAPVQSEQICSGAEIIHEDYEGEVIKLVYNSANCSYGLVYMESMSVVEIVYSVNGRSIYDFNCETVYSVEDLLNIFNEHGFKIKE